MGALADRLFSELLRERGVEEAPSQFNPVSALWVDGREFLNTHGRSAHIRLTRKIIARERSRLSNPRVESRSTDWVRVRLARASDLAFVTELARLAVAANRGSSRPTPTDREIARRRATHRQGVEDLRPTRARRSR